MSLPLPKKIRKNFHIFDAPNLSLKYYKWATFYKDGFTELKKDKHYFFDSFVKLSKGTDYHDAFSTRKELLNEIGLSFNLTTASRLLFGIGYQHPAEIGFMFDWSTGLPIIPGSSLKGMALDVARYVVKNEVEVEDLSLDDGEKIEIFGSEHDAKEKTGGNVIFLPACPITENNRPFLEVDVMTPHYQPYYSDPENNPPADWHSPVPLNFLTVPEGIRYCFRLADRRNLTDTSAPCLTNAEKLLRHALTEFGVGAKTSVSYGYFKDAPVSLNAV